VAGATVRRGASRWSATANGKGKRGSAGPSTPLPEPGNLGAAADLPTPQTAPETGPAVVAVAATPPPPAPSKADAKKATKADKKAANVDKKAAKADKKAARVGFTAAVGGSRGIQLAVRWTVGLIAVVLMVVGLVQITRPAAKTTSAADIHSLVQAQLGGTGYPSQAAEAFAARFATVYYSWSDQQARGNRVTALAAYLPNSIPDGWDGRGTQKVITGPYISGPTTSTDGKNAVVHLSLQVDSGAWLFVDVPVLSDGAGGLVVSAAPTLTTPPGQAAYPGNDGLIPNPDDSVSEAVSGVLTGFFPAWSKSDTQALSRFITPDATAAARGGLGGAVSFGSVRDVEVAAAVPGQSTRLATATVTWVVDDPAHSNVGSVSQTYLLTLEQISGLWSVKAITQGATSANSDNRTGVDAQPVVTLTDQPQTITTVPPTPMSTSAPPTSTAPLTTTAPQTTPRPTTTRPTATRPTATSSPPAATTAAAAPPTPVASPRPPVKAPATTRPAPSSAATIPSHSAHPSATG